MGRAYLVLAQWEFEGNLPLLVFGGRDAADDFSFRCEAHQSDEPDDDDEGAEGWNSWHDDHPAKPYLTNGEHLGGVQAFPVQELEMVPAEAVRK